MFNLGNLLGEKPESALELLQVLQLSQAQLLKEGIPPESAASSPSGRAQCSPSGPLAPSSSLEDWETEGGAHLDEG